MESFPKALIILAIDAPFELVYMKARYEIQDSDFYISNNQEGSPIQILFAAKKLADGARYGLSNYPYFEDLNSSKNKGCT